jgi:toxin ParE1/3/4
MNVVWTQTALEHLLAIYEHISRDSHRYALRMVDRITERSNQIARCPESGRIVPEFGSPEIRELIEEPYRVMYRIGDDRIEVIAVLHGARSIRPES